ncbi:MAG: patatin-like phospholipase family protein [Pseudomonadales bacterium]
MERHALLLAGGGARAAYQVGCLRYIARALPEYRPQILTGVSAGAINAVHLASHQGSWESAVERLRELWLALDTERVYHTELRYLLGHILGAALPLFSGGRLGGAQLRGMVSTEPLTEFLTSHLDLDGQRIRGIRRNIDAQVLDALAIITTNYDSGRSTAWVESRADELWQRGQLQAAFVDMTLAHVLASSALPLFFPAVELDGAWHGDGGVRLTAPLSPAMHLGATRILAVSPRSRPHGSIARPPATGTGPYPSPAQVAGVMLNAVFLDMLDYDALQMSRINRLLHNLPEPCRGGMRPVEVMVLRPSRDIGALAAQNEFRLPRAFRFFERGMSGGQRRNADALSMVNFEPEYLAMLMDLGEQDAEQRGEEIQAFLTGGACAVPVW